MEAKIDAMIRKRNMIFVSLHAFISKWWWIGAIRKTRLPKRRRLITWMITLAASMTKMPPISLTPVEEALQFVRRYCKGCKFHYGQSVNRVSMHVHTDEDKRALFKKLAWEWQSAPAKGKEGVKSASQVVAYIEKTFSLALKWTTWWKKRSHLIIAADMSASK